jgi:hypothetical protein
MKAIAHHISAGIQARIRILLPTIFSIAAHSPGDAKIDESEVSVVGAQGIEPWTSPV